MRRISIQDAAKCFDLIEECGEMWDDPSAWQDHLTEGIETLIGGCAGIFGATQLIGASSIDVQDANVAPSDSGLKEVFGRFQREGSFALLPEYEVIRPLVARQGKLVYRQRDLVSRRDYERSVFHQHYMRPHGIDSGLSSLQLRPDGLVIGLGVSRLNGERRFSGRDHAVLELLSACVARRIRSRLMMRDQAGRHGLSPRLRATLDALLDGATEKEVAQRLGITPATAHEYVLALYRYYGVTSRSRLLARFLRRR
jgi:DNA-binding CsgD family transcriptional regulator